MSRRPTLLAIALALTLATSAHAEPPPDAPRTMTLEDALVFARTHHLRAKAVTQRVAAAERDAEVPNAQWLPRFGAMAQLVGSTTNNSTTTLLGTSTVDIPRIGATPITRQYDLQPYPSTAIALGVRQQLYDFGRVATERTAAELAAAVERYRASGVALDVDFVVRQSYYAVLAAGAIADASRAAHVRATTHRDLARANVQSGMRPPIELTRAEADVARYEAGMMRAAANLRVSRIAFAEAVGVDDRELSAAPLPAEGPALPPLDQLLSRADHTPLVREGRARLEAQRAETRRLEAQTRPTLWATASISGRAGGASPSNGPTPDGDGWLPTVPNYNGGIVFTWPLVEPTWGRRADASRERELAATSDAELAQRTQRALVRSMYEEASVARETLGAAERGATAATANWDQAEHRFAVGLGTSTELADAQALRTEAEIQVAVARFQSARAFAALERAAATTEGR